MRNKKPRLLMIGALPPPFIGPSIALQRLVQAENLRQAFEIFLVNTSDIRDPQNIGKFDPVNIVLAIKHILHCLVSLFLQKPVIVYLNISQGIWGYLRDLGFVIPALLMRRKVVLHLRGSEFRAFYEAMPKPCQWLTRSVFKRIAMVIVLGHHLKELFKSLVEDKRIAVIPNGIDYQQFDSAESCETTNTAGKILYLSSLRKRKGLFLVLEALSDILAQYPHAHLTLAGQWQSDEERRYALECIQRHGLAEYVTFTGEVRGEEKLRLYMQHRVFVLTPIEPEGLPWVILEAMSAGLPVVTCAQGAIPDVVQNGWTGYVIAPEPKQIAEKVCYLLAHPEEARIMGLQGRRRVARYFSEAAYLQAIEQVFHTVLNNET